MIEFFLFIPVYQLFPVRRIRLRKRVRRIFISLKMTERLKQRYCIKIFAKSSVIFKDKQFTLKICSQVSVSGTENSVLQLHSIYWTLSTMASCAFFPKMKMSLKGFQSREDIIQNGGVEHHSKRILPEVFSVVEGMLG
ncbi:hypothetical protein TNCV_1361511 [Trichonephila clavipes]|nr:hypothetical protein TNCV_1361511 [Trichonephila clavipes]